MKSSESCPPSDCLPAGRDELFSSGIVFVKFCKTGLFSIWNQLCWCLWQRSLIPLENPSNVGRLLWELPMEWRVEQIAASLCRYWSGRKNSICVCIGVHRFNRFSSRVTADRKGPLSSLWQQQGKFKYSSRCSWWNQLRKVALKNEVCRRVWDVRSSLKKMREFSSWETMFFSTYPGKSPPFSSDSQRRKELLCTFSPMKELLNSRWKWFKMVEVPIWLMSM